MTLTVKFITVVTAVLTTPLTEGAKTTCEAPPAVAGEAASVTCHFHEDVSSTKRAFNVRRISSGGDITENTVLDCYWSESKTVCHRIKDGFLFDFTVSNSLTLHIPNVTVEYKGTYVCQTVPSDPQDLEECTLTVTGTESTTEDLAFSSSTVSESFGSDISTTPGNQDVSTTPGNQSNITHPEVSSANTGLAALVIIPILCLAGVGFALYCIWKRGMFCFRPKRRSFIIKYRKDDTMDDRLRRQGLLRPKPAPENTLEKNGTSRYDMDDIEEGLSSKENLDSSRDTLNDESGPEPGEQYKPASHEGNNNQRIRSVESDVIGKVKNQYYALDRQSSRVTDVSDKKGPAELVAPRTDGDNKDWSQSVVAEADVSIHDTLGDQAKVSSDMRQNGETSAAHQGTAKEDTFNQSGVDELCDSDSDDFVPCEHMSKKNGRITSCSECKLSRL